jgi:hypothetical protein
MGAPCRAPHLKAPSVAIMNSLQYETFTYDVTREKIRCSHSNTRIY